MKPTEWVDAEEQRKLLSRTFLKCALWAFFIETLLLILIGWHEHWLGHPKVKSPQEDFIETQIFEIPAESHLFEEKKPLSKAAPRETVVSKTPGKIDHSRAPVLKSSEDENQTTEGPRMVPTHGPLAVYAPAPVLPSYFRDRELQARVIIDFYINSLGTATPRLAGGSGEEELDALALEVAKKWQFRPAEKDHKPIDSKVRVRIVFEVK